MHDGKPQQQPVPERRLDKEQRTAALKVTVGVVIAVLFLLFVVQNWEPVPVNFVFFEKRLPLVGVFLACALIGAVVAWLVGRPRRRAMKRLVEELERRQKEND